MTLRKYTYYLASIWKLLTGVKPLSVVIQTFLASEPPSDQIIELRKNGLQFKTRGVMDVWSVKETFLDRFYEKFGTSIGDGWTVIDIGSGVGDFTILVASQHPTNIVYAYEPTPESFSLLEHNLRLNQVENVQVFPQAIWSKNATIAIDTNSGEPGQYTSHTITGELHPKGTVTVPGISLAEAFERTGLAHCNLLKIDCEGAEYEILFNTPDDILNRIERIVMEYHDNTTTNTHQELVEFLVNKGFAVTTNSNYVHSYLGYLFASR